MTRPSPEELDAAVTRYKATLAAWRACDQHTPAVPSGRAYDTFSAASEALENLLRRHGGLVAVQGEVWWISLANLVSHTPVGSKRHRKIKTASDCYKRGRKRSQRCPDGKGGKANAAGAGASTPAPAGAA